jgi:L(+)-tartrate dehydratase alpha subunit
MVVTMTNIMVNFINYLGKNLPDDVIKKLDQLRSDEDNFLAKVIYDSMFENLAKADALSRPCCQDTGVIQFFIKFGADFPLLSDIRTILNEAVRRATQEAPLRHNAVEIFVEKNTNNNIGERIPWIDWEIVPNDSDIHLDLYMAGGAAAYRDRERPSCRQPVMEELFSLFSTS